jgi:hypothetical protein
MAPFFTFFVDKKNTGYAAPFISKLDRYYPSFVDAVYVSPSEMKHRYAGANAKFFAFDCEELVMFDLESVDLIEPLMNITMDSFTRMSRPAWIVVFKFLKALYTTNDMPDDVLQSMNELFPPPKIIVEKTQLSKSTEPPKDPVTEYAFNFRHEDDVCFCEISKPYTDNPYTVVIRNFGLLGFEPLFTALYVCQSWGVSSMDHTFLVQLWKHLKLPGELDLENRLKLEIEKCKNGKPEPEVYRLDISGVKEQLSRKKKRTDELNDYSKFVRL